MKKIDFAQTIHGEGNQDRVLTKCAWRLIPFMGLLYVVSFIDRTNAGLAALTMNKDLGFSPTVFGFGAGIFFVGYAVCRGSRAGAAFACHQHASQTAEIAIQEEREGTSCDE